jgi:hypothetical protein
MRGFFLGFLCLIACQQNAPKTQSDCQGLSGAEAVDSCLASVAVEVVKADLSAAKVLLEAIQDPLVRDYVLLSFTREIDPSTSRWCHQIKSKQLRSRCRVLVTRPHLHRELVGGAPGRPPPGTQGPGGDLKPSDPLGDPAKHGRPPSKPSKKSFPSPEGSR